MAIEDSFHQGFLDLALAAFNRRPLTGWRPIYNMYGGAGPTTNFNAGVLETFLRNLIVIKSQTDGVRKVQVQGFPNNRNWASLDQAFIDGLSDAAKQDVWTTFYHFRKKADDAPALKRLYIHAKAPIETNGLEIIRRLLQVPNTPGLVDVKIGGPGCTDRADTIVAYFDEKESLQRVIDALQKIDFNPAWFEDGVPSGTLPLSFLKKLGVAGADEVPKLGTPGIETGSYGAFLATLIYETYKELYLQWERANQGAAVGVQREKFLESLLEACKILNVDAKTIYLTQKDHTKLEMSDEQLASELAARAKLRDIR